MNRQTKTTECLDFDQLADLVGEVPALMLYGQDGACIGREFNLSRRRGLGRVRVLMTPDGAQVLS